MVINGIIIGIGRNKIEVIEGDTTFVVNSVSDETVNITTSINPVVTNNILCLSNSDLTAYASNNILYITV